MADDVTLEDLQAIYKRFDKVEADLKETKRRLEAYSDTSTTQDIYNDIAKVRDSVKKLETKVTDLEKKIPKK